MEKGSGATLAGAVRECLQQMDRLRPLAVEIMERIEGGDLKEDFIPRVNLFLEGFDQVREAFEKLPLEAGIPDPRITEKDRREAVELFPDMIAGVEELLEAHRLMIDTIKKNLRTNSDKMEVFRTARNIFDKFVKPPKQPPPRFFDRKG
jgi:hypothetical protein